MICQVCNERSASFERGAGSHSLRICYDCLARSGMHLLGGWRLLPVGQPPAPCPDCGLSWEAFARSGRSGCPSCASRFTPALWRALRQPPLPRDEPELRAPAPAPAGVLPEEADLSMALLLEDYELAARIRDRLGEENAELKI